MPDFDFRSLYPATGVDPLPVTELDFTTCDSQSVLCLDADLFRLAPFAPWHEREDEGKLAFVDTDPWSILSMTKTRASVARSLGSLVDTDQVVSELS